MSDMHDAEVWKLQAEIERLRGVIDRAANAWLTLEPPVVWEGDVGDAMKAGVKEIERLRGLLREFIEFWNKDDNNPWDVGEFIDEWTDRARHEIGDER